MANTSYRQTFNSFSGVDMQVTCGGYLIAEIQGLSYTVTREKAPLYTMGSADPRSFSRGKRGIAGSMIFLVFDRSALLQSMQKAAWFVANQWETEDDRVVSPTQTSDGGTKKIFESNTSGVISTTVTTGTEDIQHDAPGYGKIIASAKYHDQIPPFNIVVSAANEYGHVARMEVNQCEIMNCGSGMSIDDITTDESCTFVATSLKPWHRQDYRDPRSGEFLKALPNENRPGSA